MVNETSFDPLVALMIAIIPVFVVIALLKRFDKI